MSLYWDDTCQRGVVITGGERVAPRGGLASADFEVGEVLRHELEIPQHLPPEISSLLPQNDTRMIPSDTLVANAV